MDRHQIHFGKKFYKDNQTGYWISTSKKKIRAHVWVWEQHHNLKCPKGCHIHHRDRDRSNNNIENLELMERSRHLKLHLDCPVRKKKSGENCDRIRHLTKEWHASKEGIAWHSLHAIKSKFGRWEPREYICQQCSSTYKTSKRSGSRFCSNKCKSKWRRISGIDNIEINCANCGKIFIKNKYSKTKNCTKKCAQSRH